MAEPLKRKWPGCWEYHCPWCWLCCHMAFGLRRLADRLDPLPPPKPAPQPGTPPDVNKLCWGVRDGNKSTPQGKPGKETNPMPKPKHDTLASFEAAYAQEISRVEQERAASESGIANRLIQAGLDATVTPDGTSVKVTVNGSDTAGLPAGTKRSDFTADALASLDARHLASTKEKAWQFLKRLNQRGYYTAEQVLQVLDNLGFQAKPAAKTAVAYSVYTGRNSYGDREYDSVSFELPGEYTRQQVCDKIVAGAPQTAAQSRITDVFPDAENVSAEQNFELTVSKNTVWPAHSEFHQPQDS